MLSPNVHIELLPPFCPLHSEYAPCMRCLIPDVLKIIDDKGRIKEISVFQHADNC